MRRRVRGGVGSDGRCPSGTECPCSQHRERTIRGPMPCRRVPGLARRATPFASSLRPTPPPHRRLRDQESKLLDDECTYIGAADLLPRHVVEYEGVNIRKECRHRSNLRLRYQHHAGGVRDCDRRQRRCDEGPLVRGARYTAPRNHPRVLPSGAESLLGVVGRVVVAGARKEIGARSASVTERSEPPSEVAQRCSYWWKYLDW